jgi:hypothetical protein
MSVKAISVSRNLSSRIKMVPSVQRNDNTNDNQEQVNYTISTKAFHPSVQQNDNTNGNEEQVNYTDLN